MNFGSFYFSGYSSDSKKGVFDVPNGCFYLGLDDCYLTPEKYTKDNENK
jgi:hypothetical protein